jgi:hypothetical protein
MKSISHFLVKIFLLITATTCSAQETKILDEDKILATYNILLKKISFALPTKKQAEILLFKSGNDSSRIHMGCNMAYRVYTSMIPRLPKELLKMSVEEVNDLLILLQYQTRKYIDVTGMRDTKDEIFKPLNDEAKMYFLSSQPGGGSIIRQDEVVHWVFSCNALVAVMNK